LAPFGQQEEFVLVFILSVFRMDKNYPKLSSQPVPEQLCNSVRAVLLTPLASSDDMYTASDKDLAWHIHAHNIVTSIALDAVSHTAAGVTVTVSAESARASEIMQKHKIAQICTILYQCK